MLLTIRHNTRKVHDLWWLGLPPGVRGKVWKKAIGNDLNVSSGKSTIMGYWDTRIPLCALQTCMLST